ncbi:7 transmembrane sweet-taste receptor of 3 GCPR-domain-containing protein [Polychytrium aggregatum]|uniref:7 transmembrane sweet-taste receptor of 3 GCPR-domain-containing protein n=1 Tax=Polychytrium aggregatum TaxID=110093 RepID=UPI0022FE900D|nr:7 transmembrane sweet-taste receptor of 3 GCPR-domain-containing protein [Polychytrium aggregatum]KAI9197324.1 7 transmembrane sweet-taste receptor of 3 GCPR-domain-containing protein [Polychytrium aggregatum]
MLSVVSTGRLLAKCLLVLALAAYAAAFSVLSASPNIFPIAGGTTISLTLAGYYDPSRTYRVAVWNPTTGRSSIATATFSSASTGGNVNTTAVVFQSPAMDEGACVFNVTDGFTVSAGVVDSLLVYDPSRLSGAVTASTQGQGINARSLLANGGNTVIIALPAMPNNLLALANVSPAIRIVSVVNASSYYDIAAQLSGSTLTGFTDAGIAQVSLGQQAKALISFDGKQTFHDLSLVYTLTYRPPINILLTCSSPPTDSGFGHSLNVGLNNLKIQFGSSISIYTLFNIGFNTNYQLIHDTIQQNSIDIAILGVTISQQLNLTVTLTQNFPSLKVLTWTTSNINPIPANTRWYSLRQEEAKYLTGYAAGLFAKSRSDVSFANGNIPIGYLLPMEIPRTMIHANMFLLGLQKAIPGAKMITRSIGTFYYPFAETQVSQQFLADGVKVLGYQTDTVIPVAVFTSNGSYIAAANTDPSGDYGNRVLATASFDWITIFGPFVQNYIDGVPLSDTAMVNSGLLSGLTYITGISGWFDVNQVAAIQAEVARLKSLPDNSRYCGPIYDVNGNTIIGPNDCLNFTFTNTLNTYFQGIVPMGQFNPVFPYENRHLISMGLRIVIFLITALSQVITLGITLLIILNREQPQIKGGSPTFLVLMGFSASIALCGNYLMGMDDNVIQDANTLNAACMATPYVIVLPMMLMFGALLIKMWRIYRIFKNPKAEIISFRPHELFFTMAAPMLVSLGIILVWNFTAPLEWIRTIINTDSFGNSIESSGLCKSSTTLSFDPFPISIFFIFMAILLTSFWIGHSTRNVPSQFNEEKNLRSSISFWVQVVVVLYPLNYSFSDPSGLFTLRSLMNVSATMGTTVFVLGSKLWGASEEQNQRKGSASASTWKPESGTTTTTTVGAHGKSPTTRPSEATDPRQPLRTQPYSA